MGFMMPISTPPNAIVYSSGYIPIGAMMRNGIALDIAVEKDILVSGSSISLAY
jgi:di/tricarboxylate transporter